MIRLLVTAPLSADFALPLDDGQSRYLTQVMRKGAGDEVLVFKAYDSDKSQSCFVPHTAFHNPQATAESEPRSSIEARFVAFFD